MRKCRKCQNYYNNSLYSHCPFCSGELDDPNIYEFEEEEVVVKKSDLSDEELQFMRYMDSPGIFDDEGEWVRCPICGMGVHNYKGTKTCPNCGPVE